jgi:hypothetical protein
MDVQFGHLPEGVASLDDAFSQRAFAAKEGIAEHLELAAIMAGKLAPVQLCRRMLAEIG